MVKIWDALKILGEDMLNQIEIDTLQISRNCTRQCSHCSQEQGTRVQLVSLGDFKRALNSLVEIKSKTGNDLLSNYVLTTTDSDPFLHTQLANIVQRLHDTTGKNFYLLTSGWYLDNGYADAYQKNAEWIAENPEIVERVALTLSNFPTNPISNYQNVGILANVVRTFGGMPDDKFVISPQYNGEVSETDKHSEKQTKILLKDVLSEVSYTKRDFAGRIFYRPVIGLGRASTILGVEKVEQYRIEAEDPIPEISTREAERPYSGYVNLESDLLVIEAPRAILNRELGEYKPAEELIG